MTSLLEWSEACQSELEVLVGPAAWVFHEELSTGKVDVEKAYLVRQNVRLVAADVLRAAAAQAKMQGPDATSFTKKIQAGPLVLEKTATQSQLTLMALAWEALALRLEEVGVADFEPLVTGWGIA